MTKEEKKLIELLEFSVNEKANKATSMMQSAKTSGKVDFYNGQHLAFSEVYTMLQNIKRTL